MKTSGGNLPTVKDNIKAWTSYPWSQQGDEWSHDFGGTDYLWWGIIYPRILGFLPVNTGLEIGPGYGRFTQFLKDFCKHLVIVDITPNCIEACKNRFKDCRNIAAHVNDGISLPMVDDHSIDFVFSFDSLVHAEFDVMGAYLHELSKKLAPDGVGFIHHSNLASFIDPSTTKLPFENLHHRAESMSAELFCQYCDECSLECICQELVNWGGSQLIDSLSVFTPKGSRYSHPAIVRENHFFMREAQTLGAIAKLYGTIPSSSRGGC